MSVTFDGPNKQIVLDTSTTEYTAVEIYSRWKDWVSTNNAQYLEAFGSVGGDPLGDEGENGLLGIGQVHG